MNENKNVISRSFTDCCKISEYCLEIMSEQYAITFVVNFKKHFKYVSAYLT